jgi:ribosomal protein L6P/L9E
MITITAISNAQYTSANTQTIDVVLNTLELGSIPCTLSYNDNTIYNIYDSTSNTYVSTTNQGLYTSVQQNSNITPFVVDVTYSKQALNDAIVNTCNYIVDIISPTGSKQVAYNNAVILLTINNGNPPTVQPVANAFNNMAASWGLSPNNFANLVMGLQTTSMTLASIEQDAQNMVSAANSANSLLTALYTFETEINSVVTGVNAVLPIPMTPPNNIIIKGLNI